MNPTLRSKVRRPLHNIAKSMGKNWNINGLELVILVLLLAMTGRNALQTLEEQDQAVSAKHDEDHMSNLNNTLVWSPSDTHRILQRASRRYEECKEALSATAFNKGRFIYSTQFDNFIRLYSQRQILIYGFNDLPLKLILDFNSLACSFCDGANPTFNTYCCETENAQYIDLGLYPNQNFAAICSRIDNTFISLGLQFVPAPTPTRAPTKPPTKTPTRVPTKHPTKAPVAAPVDVATPLPTARKTLRPTGAPSLTRTDSPTATPVISQTTSSPTRSPSGLPTIFKTAAPTRRPSFGPTRKPTRVPTKPSSPPTRFPTRSPEFNGTMEFSLLLNMRLDGVDSAAFSSGTSPENHEKLKLTEATSFAIQRILKDRGFPASLTSIEVSQIRDDPFLCFFDPPERENVKCLSAKVTAFLERSPGTSESNIEQLLAQGLKNEQIQFQGTEDIFFM